MKTALPTSVVIHSIEVQPVEFRGQRVLTFAQIDKLHGRPEGTARKRFNDNESRMTADEDFYRVDYSQMSVFRTFGIDVPPRGLTVVTESGYLLLVKSFTDDLAWAVQKELVKVYFRAKALEHLDTLIPSEVQTLHEIIDRKAASVGAELRSKAYSEIYTRLQNHFRANSYKLIPRSRLADAIVYVTGLELRCAPTPAPQAVELLTNNDVANLQRLVWCIAHWFNMEPAWVQGIWYALRQATGVPSPQRFRVSDLPVITAELRRIWIASRPLHDTYREAQRVMIKRVVRGGEPIAALLAEQQQHLLEIANDEHDRFTSQLDSWNERELARLIGRERSGSHDHSDASERMK